MKFQPQLAHAEFTATYRMIALIVLGIIVLYCVYEWYLERRRRKERRDQKRPRRKGRR